MNAAQAKARIVDYFESGGKPGFEEDTFTWRYRTDDGGKCAVGCLIPDDVYDPRMEKRSIWSVEVMDDDEPTQVLRQVMAASDIDLTDNELVSFLRRAQGEHDDLAYYGHSPQDIAEAIRNIPI